MDEIFFSKYFINKPESINYSIGAQFIVSREAILNRNLLEDFKRNDIPERLSIIMGRNADPHAFDYFEKSSNTNRMPWLLERVWSIIFNKNFKTIYDTQL